LLLDVLDEFGNGHSHLLRVGSDATLDLLNLLGSRLLAVGKPDGRHAWGKSGLPARRRLLLLACRRGLLLFAARWRLGRW
jgi:hypothetical protein